MNYNLIYREYIGLDVVDNQYVDESSQDNVKDVYFL